MALEYDLDLIESDLNSKEDDFVYIYRFGDAPNAISIVKKYYTNYNRSRLHSYVIVLWSSVNGYTSIDIPEGVDLNDRLLRLGNCYGYEESFVIRKIPAKTLEEAKVILEDILPEYTL